MITSADIETRWYKDNARACGLGYEADVVAILAGVECGGYMIKYLTKAIAVIGWPKYWRRVNTSRKWPKPEEPETPYDWSNLGDDVLRVKFSMTMYEQAGWTIETSLQELILPFG